MKHSAVLLIDCPDRKGLVAAIANFLLEHNANILHADQHQDSLGGLFFMRVEWDLAGFSLKTEEFEKKFAPIAEKFQMRWKFRLSNPPVKAAIFVSRQYHCLADLLYRHNSGEICCDIPLIISNHPQAKRLADFYGIPFTVIQVDSNSKEKAEKAQMDLLAKNDIGLVILARYMQILSPRFVAAYPQKIINVHHSFLPAFSGADPYQQAFQRGVKLIGATSHYVTDVLDDGPIIEQDVVRISHREQREDLAKKGSDLEKVALSRAVRWHLDNRVLVYGKKTVVFD